MVWAFVALQAFAWPVVAHAQIAVVVHKSTPASDATSESLRRVFLGSSTVFLAHNRVKLVECGPLKTKFYRDLLNMTSDEIKRRWMQIVFSGEFGTPPTELADDSEVKRYVALHPGAVGFISAASVDETVKVLKIDGVGPRQANYMLP